VHVKQNLKSAENGFGEFARKNTALASIGIAFWPHDWSQWMRCDLRWEETRWPGKS
jgi:hypothetical protein